MRDPKPLEAAGAEIVIPSNGSRRHAYPLDRTADRRRDVIERMFCRMKDWRRIPARYDRLAGNYLSAVANRRDHLFLAHLIGSAT
ncbi:hypothetical protein [Rhizosaccharibacter radicis]|uniref:hypothetical protein n=1 Tax=Rhizosaccharibacter radicis TaxID=2782605 RepID=UPI003BF5C860